VHCIRLHLAHSVLHTASRSQCIAYSIYYIATIVHCILLHLHHSASHKKTEKINFQPRYCLFFFQTASLTLSWCAITVSISPFSLAGWFHFPHLPSGNRTWLENPSLGVYGNIYKIEIFLMLSTKSMVDLRYMSSGESEAMNPK
jgi:hypothetical protein